MVTRGGKRENAGRKPGSSGIKKTKLKAPEALKVTKGIRFTPEQIERATEAVQKSGAKNFSAFVVTATMEKVENVMTDGEQSHEADKNPPPGNSE